MCFKHVMQLFLNKFTKKKKENKRKIDWYFICRPHSTAARPSSCNKNVCCKLINLIWLQR